MSDKNTYMFNGEAIDTSAMLFQQTFTFPKPNYNLVFHRVGDNGFIAEEVGHLDFNGPALIFEGNAEESAKLFFDHIAKLFEERLKEEYQRGYEDCLTEESK